MCGRIRGYQYTYTRAFDRGHLGIDGSYVEGVSLTHDFPGNRTHIWTFAAGLTELFTGVDASLICPCLSGSVEPPPYVGNDYFCESGVNGFFNIHHHRILHSDPLWDGQNCLDDCMCQPQLPFFVKNLPAPTREDIELRICSHSSATDGGTIIDQVELYVQ